MNGWLVALVAVVALAVSTLGGSPLTALVLRTAARSGDAGVPEDGSTAPTAPDRRSEGPEHRLEDDGGDGPVGPRAREALRGGTWIGILERTAVTGCLLAGYPAGVALVIAVKGLGRYPELREHPGASERFVIGTLASLIWAAAVGMAGLTLISR